MSQKKVGSVVVTDEMIERAMHANAEGANYTGAGDNCLNIGASKTFLNEDKTGRRVSLTLDNTKGSEDVTIQLNEILAKLADHHVIADGAVGETGMTISSTPCKSEVLAAYLKLFPTRLHSIKFAASAAAQLDEPIRSYAIDPFSKNPVEIERIPSNFQSQNTNNPLMVDVDDFDDNFQMSALSTLTYTVQAGVKVTLTLLFGASFDIAGALKKKAEDAALTVATAYVKSNQTA